MTPTKLFSSIRPFHLVMGILPIYCIGFILHFFIVRSAVYGDGIFYYSWLRSAVVDHDVSFANEYSHFSATQPSTFKGTPGNKYTIGPALVWAPTYITIHSVIRGSGYEEAYQLVVGFVSIFAGYVGLVLLFSILNPLIGPWPAVGAIVTIALATNLWFYSSIDPINSHAISFFFAVLFLTGIFKKVSWYILGTFLGCIFLTRYQDTVWIIALIPFISVDKLIKLVKGFLPALLLQAVVWSHVYGTPIAFPYLGNGEGFSFIPIRYIEVLFSPTNGIFLWTPIVIIGLAGLLFIPPKVYPNRWILLSTACVAYVTISSWSSWLGGASFGSRLFISMLPLSALGLGYIYQKLMKYTGEMVLFIGGILPLSTITGILMIYFLARW